MAIDGTLIVDRSTGSLYYTGGEYMTKQRHESHPAIVQRLRRVEGQVRSIAAMIESGRSCLDVAQQLAAATSALMGAKDTFIRDHIDHCLTGAVGSDGRDQLSELKAITKFL
jgi:uncharacterized protein